MIYTLLLCMGLFLGDIPAQQEYQSPDMVGDEYIGDPYSMDFGDDGKLYLVDRLQATVHHWNADGTYAGRFGKQGEGPGDLFYPVKVCAAEDRIWVWDFQRKISRFDTTGKFIDSFKLPRMEPKTFAVLDDKLVFGYRNTADTSKIRYLFEVTDHHGKLLATLQDHHNQMFLKPISEKKERVKAFGPQGDIQRDDQGNLYIGYSQENLIYRLDGDGKIAAKLRFELPATAPTQQEIETVKAMDVPSGQGGRLALTDLIDFDFDHKKAYYTHFLIKGNRIAFILNPLGGLGVLNAYHRGDYVVCDLKTGKPLNRGSFEYPVDSRVFFRNGRALAVINEDDAFKIKEITLQGM